MPCTCRLLVDRSGLLAATLALALFAGATHAQDAAAPPETEYVLGAYIWGTAIDATIQAHNASASVDASFSDVLDNLNFSAMLVGGVRHGRLLGQLDVMWSELETDATTRVLRFGPLRLGPGRIESTMQLGMADLKLGYRVLEASAERPFELDLLIGARYWYSRTELDFDLPPVLSIDVDESTDWLDPVVGARFVYEWTPDVQLIAQGDFGFWSLGSASDDTWQLMGLVGYRLSDAWSLRAGYRAIEFDRERTDFQLHGPIFAAVHRF